MADEKKSPVQESFPVHLYQVKDKITGQLFIRETKDPPPNDKDDRRLVMFFGILAIPKDVDLPAEHQATVVGSPTATGLSLKVLTSPNMVVDQRERAAGETPSQLMTNPIWRV